MALVGFIVLVILNLLFSIIMFFTLLHGGLDVGPLFGKYNRDRMFKEKIMWVVFFCLNCYFWHSLSSYLHFG